MVGGLNATHCYVEPAEIANYAANMKALRAAVARRGLRIDEVSRHAAYEAKAELGDLGFPLRVRSEPTG